MVPDAECTRISASGQNIIGTKSLWGNSPQLRRCHLHRNVNFSNSADKTPATAACTWHIKKAEQTHFTAYNRQTAEHLHTRGSCMMPKKQCQHLLYQFWQCKSASSGANVSVMHPLPPPQGSIQVCYPRHFLYYTTALRLYPVSPIGILYVEQNYV